MGLALGLAGSLGLTRFLAAQLYQTDPRDPAVLASSLVCLAVLATCTSYVPAQRAAAIDPARSLHGDSGSLSAARFPGEAEIALRKGGDVRAVWLRALSGERCGEPRPRGIRALRKRDRSGDAERDVGVGALVAAVRDVDAPLVAVVGNVADPGGTLDELQVTLREGMPESVQPTATGKWALR